MPAIGMPERADQLVDRCGAQIGLESRRDFRLARHGSVDPTKRVAAAEVHIFVDRLWNRFRRLDEFAIDIGNVEIAGGGVGEIADARPRVGGREDLDAISGAMGGERNAIRGEDIAVHQIAIYIAGENAADVLGRKRIAGISGAATGGGEVSANFFGEITLIFVIALLAGLGALLAPGLRLGERKDPRGGLAVIGDIHFRGSRIEQRRAHQVLHREHDMAQVDGVLRREAIAPVVEGQAELRGTGSGLVYAADGIKPEIAATNLNGRPFVVGGRRNLTTSSGITAPYPLSFASYRIFALPFSRTFCK